MTCSTDRAGLKPAPTKLLFNTLLLNHQHNILTTQEETPCPTSPTFSRSTRSEIVPGVRIRTLWGDKVMMSLIETDPHTDVPEHTHPHEQAGMVLEGEFDMTIGGERQTMKRGMSYVIPGGVPHALHGGPGRGLVLDIFSPPREDYKERIAQSIDPAWETTEG